MLFRSLTQNPGQNAVALVDRLGTDLAFMRSELALMEAAGVVRREGRTKATTWFAVSPVDGMAVTPPPSFRVRVDRAEGVAGTHHVFVTVTAPVAQVGVTLRVRDNPTARVDVWLRNVRMPAVFAVETGQSTELFFRVHANTSLPVAVEVAVEGDGEPAAALAGWFEAEMGTSVPAPPKPVMALAEIPPWLAGVAGAEYHVVLAHIATHGSVTEGDIAGMIGSRRARGFSDALENVAASLPFRVFIDVVDGVKRYSRDA